MKRILQGVLALTLLTSFTASYSACGSNSCCNDGCSTNNCTGCSDCGCNDCKSNCCLGPCDGYPTLGYRSQSRNAAREICGTQNFINQFGKDETYGQFSLALEYTRSFKPEHLSKYFFGSDLDCANTLYIQGGDYGIDPDKIRNPKAWLADYFGLPTDFSSQVKFCPRIENVLVDMNLHLGLDGWAKGLFFKIYSPITWTKWELNMTECIKASGTVPFDHGYMSDPEIARANLPASFTEGVSGTTVFGDMKEAMKFGRMSTCPLTKVGLADMRTSIGWNFCLEEDYHFGLFVHAAAPTGNRPGSCYLFEPVVGNGHHWELGGGLTSAWTFWRSKEYDARNIGLWFDATLTHLFNDSQCRSFDFCNKPNSRYMLLEQMGTNNDDIRADINGTKTVADYQYQSNLIPAINWSTFKVDVSVGVQADLALKLGYNRENWAFDLGYNLWARSGEKFCQDCCNDCCNSCDSCTTCSSSDKQYAIKGSTYVYGYDAGSTPYGLSATESTADIHYTAPTAAQVLPCRNPKIDNPYPAYKDTTIDLDCWSQTYTTQTSYPAVLATKSLLNMSNSPSAITHKIFAHINHEWKDRDDNWVPFVGVGFEVEMAQGGDCCEDNCGSCCNNCNNSSCTTPALTSCNSACNSGCNSCGCDNDCCCTTKKAGVYQYGLWFKGGVAFN